MFNCFIERHLDKTLFLTFNHDIYILESRGRYFLHLKDIYIDLTYILFLLEQIKSKIMIALTLLLHCLHCLHVDVLQVGLNEHNKYRKTHNSPPLSLSSQLNSDAQAEAERVAAQGQLAHTEDSELGDQGENLGKLCASDETPEEIIAKVIERW